MEYCLDNCQDIVEMIMDDEPIDRSSAAGLFSDSVTHVQTEGRPYLHVGGSDAITELHDMMGTWTRVAGSLGVSARTLLRRREEHASPIDAAIYSAIHDEALDDAVSDILSAAPASGEVYVRGALISRGIRVQRSRLRQSIRKVDPMNRAIRRAVPISRRRYNV